MKRNEYDAKRYMAESKQPSRHYRADDLGPFPAFVGLASVIAMVAGLVICIAGGVSASPDVALAGAWMIAGGAVGLFMLILGGNK